ncbi:RING/U-box superfamily protein [Striga asiatica]|uniref:RING/U-box superfamily protein n=1 Tax=Striga asiatica TaxID=4170 RepID=A0A5A7R6L6_STRAF|nr:RING/U-box superfamily protein [Striga asiatica]
MAKSLTYVLAFRPPIRIPKPDPENLTVQVSITLGSAPTNRAGKFFPIIDHTPSKTDFRFPRSTFLSTNLLDQLDKISEMLDRLEIPFPFRENIHWGILDFPSDNNNNNSRSLNLDEIKSRLLENLRACANDESVSKIDVRIGKLEKIRDEDYKRLADEREGRRNNSRGGRGPLDGWIRENSNDVRLRDSRWFGILRGLTVRSPTENKCFGMRSVKVFGGENNDECSICLKGLKKGSEAIRMPCEHVFHGFCILRWVYVNPSCPFCRSRLCDDGVIGPEDGTLLNYFD